MAMPSESTTVCFATFAWTSECDNRDGDRAKRERGRQPGEALPPGAAQAKCELCRTKRHRDAAPAGPHAPTDHGQ